MMRLRRGKVARLGAGADGAFGDDAALVRQAGVEVGVFGWIDVVHPAAQHRDGAGGQGAFVGCGVDAARHARDDDMTGLAQLLRQAARDPLAARRGDAGADDGDAEG
jgi:hypothetical protein